MSHLEPSRRPRRARIVVRIGLQAGLVALFVVAALLGTLSGVLFAYAGDLPQITALDDYRPNTITRLLAADGRVIEEYAQERRVVIDYDDIAPVLRQAILASEDADFEQHFGLSIPRILVTAFRDVIYGQRAGASTITQQVARTLFLQAEYMQGGVFARTGTRGWERKLKEAILAVQLEKRYTKREIFEFYANHVFLGHGAYGVEAASRMYLDKSADELTLEEAATIAAIIQTPSRLSPYVNPEQARARRNNYVLRRMVDEGFITEEEATEAAARPLVVVGQPSPEPSVAPYFAEEIRQHLERAYSADTLYEAGLQVQTTLDVGLQQAANEALDAGLRRLDKQTTGWRGAEVNVLGQGGELETFRAERWKRPILEGDIVPALVTVVSGPGGNGSARVRIADDEVELPPVAFEWTRRRTAAQLFEVGDVIEVKVQKLDGTRPVEIALEQRPLVQGALLAIENRTGAIRAMAGGSDFARSKFNRAVQARRQVGSLFKPIVYTAAIDRGFTPVSIFIDEPVAFDVGPGQPPYSPLNYTRDYEGPITLRRALEQSRNIPAVKAMAELGPAQVVEYAQRFGFGENYPPYLSLALGAAEATLMEMTSAYSAFPNQGVRMEPYAVVSVADREGNILEEHRALPREAVRADTAFVMTNLLRGVVQHGTGRAALVLDWPVGGKTGTVDDYTDAWFVGFDPNITVGVWVGYDEKKPLGSSQTGGTTALPIWIDFMRAYIERYGDRNNPPEFEAPGNIVYVTLESGLTEAFINGTQPQLGGPIIPATPAPVTPAPEAPAPAGSTPPGTGVAPPVAEE